MLTAEHCYDHATAVRFSSVLRHEGGPNIQGEGSKGVQTQCPSAQGVYGPIVVSMMDRGSNYSRALGPPVQKEGGSNYPPTPVYGTFCILNEGVGLKVFSRKLQGFTSQVPETAIMCLIQ